MKLMNTKNLSHEEWLEQRKRGIGGSDIGSIFGLNQYKSTVELWLEKTGKISKPNITDLSDRENFSEPAYWGILEEEMVAKRFTEETGLKVRRNNHILQHRTYPFMVANVDREGRDQEGKKFVLECKTANEFASKDWEGDYIPLSYELQTLYYVLIGEYDYGYIACKIGNRKFVIKKVELDQFTEKTITEKCQWFWDLVESNTMPPVDGSEACGNILTELYPEAKQESSITLDDKLDDLLIQRDDLKSQVETLKSQIDYIDNTLKQELADYESGYTNNYKVSWKNVTSNRFDTKAFEKAHPELKEQFTKTSTSRRFDVKKLKGEK